KEARSSASSAARSSRSAGAGEARVPGESPIRPTREGARGLGAALGREIYSRSRRAGLEPATRTWLLEIARLGSWKEGPARRPRTLQRLLSAGAARAGMRF